MDTGVGRHLYRNAQRRAQDTAAPPRRGWAIAYGGAVTGLDTLSRDTRHRELVLEPIDEAHSVPWHMGHPGRVRSLPGRKRTVSKQAFFLAARCLLVKVPGYGMRWEGDGRTCTAICGRLAPKGWVALQGSVRIVSRPRWTSWQPPAQRSRCPLRLCASRLMPRDERRSRFPFDLLRPERRLASQDVCGAALLRLGVGG